MARPLPDVDFGTCWSCTVELTDPAVMVTGFRVIAEAIVRRWQTPRGALIDDPNYGYDVAQWTSGDMGPGDLARVASEAGAEAEKDERVLSCDVTVSVLTGNAMNVIGKVETSKGPFTLVVGVDQVSVTLLQVAA